MGKTIVVCGHGPGISDAVARKFGSEGFSVALVARNAERLSASVAALNANGVKAQAFATDLGDLSAVTALFGKVRESLGPVSVIHWNAYAGVAGDLLTAPLGDLQTVLNVGVVGLVAAVQGAYADLKASEKPAVLVTGGGFAFYDPNVDAMATQFNAMGLATSKAAQHKLVGLLSQKLKADGIYVGEVVVTAMVKGTAFDFGNATLEASTVAAKFWELYSARETVSVNLG